MTFIVIKCIFFSPVDINPSNELKKETLEEENKRLRKELSLVKQEREILKKAAAYFAKETL